MLKCIVLLAVFGCAQSLLWGLIGTEQSAAARGKLTCNGQPAANIRVKLWEKEATLDVKMGETTTNDRGEFEISGFKTEASTIDPKISIYHKCGYNGILSSACYRKMSITIPDDFVSDGKNPEKVFDIGTMNLASKFSGQTTDCIN